MQELSFVSAATLAGVQFISDPSWTCWMDSGRSDSDVFLIKQDFSQAFPNSDSNLLNLNFCSILIPLDWSIFMISGRKPVGKSAFKRDSNPSISRRVYIYFHEYQTFTFTFLLIVFIFFVTRYFASGQTSSSFNIKNIRRNSHADSIPPQVKLFIAIGTAPDNFELREAARKGWLTWVASSTISDVLIDDSDNNEHSKTQRPDAKPKVAIAYYRFFTDNVASLKNHEMITNLLWESSKYKDIEFYDKSLGSGYGDNENNLFAKRAMYQMKWSVDHIDFQHYLRLDDDVFLCGHRLRYEIERDMYPKNQFFWGKYWCKAGRMRADENFMFFSNDIVRLLAQENPLIPMDTNVTFAWNFGLISWFLNITIFDDQNRIDSQQLYKTSYMHDSYSELNAQNYKQFCNDFIYAHHVNANVSMAVFKNTKLKAMYSAPEIKSPKVTCPRKERSFIPRRHSKTLPDIQVQFAD